MTLDSAAGKVGETEISDRLGWVSDAFTIRGAASKLGWERGQAEDGGWFHEYTKRFGAADLVAVIACTGNGLPEENRAAAVKTLSFRKTGRGYGAVKLKDVPPVLLSECWNDYHGFAAKAKFDENWEKTCGW
jgi:hypothetical protein